MKSIIDSNDYRDRYGLLGKVVLEENVETTIFVASRTTEFIQADINICNPTIATATFSIWISSSKNVSIADLYEYNVKLSPGATYVRNNIKMSPNEHLIIKSDTDNIVVRLVGHDNRKEH